MKKSRKIGALVLISAVLVFLTVLYGFYNRYDPGLDKITETAKSETTKDAPALVEKDARSAPAANETPEHLLALIEERAKGKYGPYLTLEEVVAEATRTGKFPAILSYYLLPTWDQLRVRLIKIDGEFHVIEHLEYPFIALNRGYHTKDGVWLVDVRDGAVLLRAEHGQAVLKEQWARLVPADSILNNTGVERGPWHGFGILQPFGLSPDGSKLGFFLYSRHGGIFDHTAIVGFIDLQTNTPQFTGIAYFGDYMTWRPRWSPTGAHIYYGDPHFRDDASLSADIATVNRLHVDSTAAGQRSFRLPSLEMLTLLFPAEVREAREKFKAPDFGGYLSLESAIGATVHFLPWFGNLKWSPGDSSLTFTTVAKRAVFEDKYREAHSRNKVKEEFGQAQWIINADGSGLRLKDVVRGQ
jgi:hypothetical protein